MPDSEQRGRLADSGACRNLDGDGWPELLSERGYIGITPNQAVSSDVKVFRQLADKVKGNYQGNSEIERVRLAFDPCHREVNQIVFIDWPAEFQRRLMAWLAQFLPPTLACLNGQPATLTVTQPMLNEINALLDEVESRSTPELKSVFRSERERLNHLRDFERMSYDQIVTRLDLGDKLRILKGLFQDQGFGFALFLSGSSNPSNSLWRVSALGRTNRWVAVPGAIHRTDGTNAVLIDPDPPGPSAIYRVGKPIQ